MTWITIDPGLTGTGWAVWDHRVLCESGSISGGDGEWHERATHITDAIATIAMLAKISKAYYELPQFIQSRYEVNASGDLIKLTICAGMIAGRLTSQALVTPVRIIDWKGQLDKKLTLARVKLALSKRGGKLTGTTTHEADAVGIGLYLLGEF